MAAIPLNVFKTIRHEVTTSNVGIYTAPTGVSSIILYAQVSNVSSGSTTYNVTASHSRGGTDFEIIKSGPVPANDAIVLLNGKLVLETGDSFKIYGNQNSTLKLVMSVLETAKA